MVVAVYPGTFDPVTNGHLDIVVRAARLFDRLIVGIYEESPKNVLFSTGERVEMMSEAVSYLPNVSVQPYSGLTVEFAKRVGARTLVRGLRAISDFELEIQMAHMNRELAPEIEFVLLMTSVNYAFLSSSIVKEVACLGGDISGLVPEGVAVSLRRKYNAVAEHARTRR
ncbi:MAG: pantetheine-phosphate adenylyltransferase [Chloroflexi bacterium]|nr:pantetheine-phosphate adenylyltransferase [Chloroflexota bacterium]